MSAGTASGSGLARSTAVMAAGTLLSRLTGFARLAALTAALGATESRLADAYNTANVAPNIVYELVLGGVLSSVLIPIFVETLRRDEAEHRHVVNTVTTLAGAVLVAIALVTVAAAPLIAAALTAGAEGAPGEVAEQRAAVTLFLRLFMPQVVFYGLTTIFTAYLNAHRRFAAPMFWPVANNVVVVAVLLLFRSLVGAEATDLSQIATAQLYLLGVGTTAGIAAMTVPLWPAARRVAWSWRPSFDWRHPMVRRIGRLGGWTVLYVLVNQAGYLVVVVLANAIATGAYSAYVYAFTIFQLPHGIYAVSVMTALVPAMAEAGSAGDRDAFRAHLSRGIRATALLIVPAGVGMAVLARPLVALLLERGIFSAESTALVAAVLTAFALGLPSFSLFQLLLRAHYALQDTRSPALVNVAAVALNVAVDLLAFLTLDGTARVVGLAVGHASAYTLGSAVFAWRLRRRLDGLDGRRTGAALARIAAATVVMAAAVAATAALVPGEEGAALLLRVVAAVVVGAGTYLAAARLLGVEELAVVGRMVRRRVGGG